MELRRIINIEEKKNRLKKELIGWAKMLVIVLILVVAIRTFLITNYIVYGTSMMPTIHDRERVLVNKIGYDLGSPQRFDMIIFHATETKDYIKRIIGLPGDTIEYRDDNLYVNGELIEETFLNGMKSQHKERPYTDDFTLELLTGKKTVPEDHIFVLGDNRGNSLDSRYLGFIPMEKIVGKANVAYWPIKNLRQLK